MTVEYGLWHTIRYSDASWQGSFGSVDSMESNPIHAFSDAACAATGSQLQAVAVGPGGQLYHTVRNANGTWQPFFGHVEGIVAGAPGPFSQVCCAGFGSDFHVVALDPNGQLWHTVRHGDGSWQPTFVPVPFGPTAPGGFLAASAVHGDDELVVAAVGSDGWIYTNAREDSDASWSTFSIVAGQPNDGGPHADVAIARLGTDYHVVAVSQGGFLFHSLFHSVWPLGWQGFWGSIQGVEANAPEPFSAVDCGFVGNDLHVAAVGDGGQLWHTIRYPDTSWQSSFGWVNGQEANGNVVFTAVGAAAFASELHVVGLAWQHD